MRVWTCSAGSFAGFEYNECAHARGIRYAESQRYDRPVPYTYGSGVHECVDPAPFAMQNQSLPGFSLQGTAYQDLPQKESCQYLSLTVPETATPEDKLPVMVWFHGGAYRNGGCDAPGYSRAFLAREGNVIVVGVNYRLGVLGFVRDRAGNLANNGLLDAIEALKWVQTNIAAFGGDPENVTLFGQSAGADLVRCIMLSNGTDNLYRRAIIQSDPIGTMQDRAIMDRRMLKELNAVPIDVSTQELRDVQARILSQVKEKSFARFMAFGPHYGVDPLPEMRHFRARLQEIAPSHELLIGCNTRELAAYIAIRKGFKSFDLFPLTRWAAERHVHRAGLLIFNEPTSVFARSYAQAGGAAYEYSFSWLDDKSPLGAGHAMDLLPLFGPGKATRTCATLGVSPDEVLEAGVPMRAIWSDFAKTGAITRTEIEGMLRIWQHAAQ